MSSGLRRRVARRSLRWRLLWRVLLPLAITWLVGGVVALYVAAGSTAQAYDRGLLDDAYALAANVVARDGGPVLAVSPRDIGNILFDHFEQETFAVWSPDGRLVAGLPELRPQAVDGSQPWAFGSASGAHGTLRTATLLRTEAPAAVVVVAQTTASRDAILRGLVVRAVVPQLVLLLALGLALRWQITREIAPVVSLHRQLDRRDSNDLTPVEVRPLSRDIERLRRSINSLMARIERGARAQREFAGNVAHDLKTPLAGIRALAEYGLARDEPAVWRAQLAAILASEDRATRLLEQLLALALADEVRDSVRSEVVRVDELVGRTVLGYLSRADATGVDLGATGVDAAVEAWCAPALLEGLLGNLVDNALRYGRGSGAASAAGSAAGSATASPGEAGRAPVVTIEVARRGGTEVEIAVVDDGPGIEPARREQLLQRWEQGPTGVRLGQGAGLGLAIAARYAQLMGSRLALGAGADGRGLRAAVVLRAASV